MARAVIFFQYCWSNWAGLSSNLSQGLPFSRDVLVELNISAGGRNRE